MRRPNLRGSMATWKVRCSAQWLHTPQLRPGATASHSTRSQAGLRISVVTCSLLRHRWTRGLRIVITVSGLARGPLALSRCHWRTRATLRAPPCSSG